MQTSQNPFFKRIYVKSGSSSIDMSKYTELSNAEVVDLLKARYLGNLNVAEFDNVYDWWNFGGIASKAKDEDV